MLNHPPQPDNQRADRLRARTAAWRSPINPYQEGSRLHRYYVKARKWFERHGACEGEQV